MLEVCLNHKYKQVGDLGFVTQSEVGVRATGKVRKVAWSTGDVAFEKSQTLLLV